MRITESRLRQIIREAMYEVMAGDESVYHGESEDEAWEIFDDLTDSGVPVELKLHREPTPPPLSVPRKDAYDMVETDPYND